MKNKREILNRNDATEVLTPHYNKIVTAIYAAFQDYLDCLEIATSKGLKVDWSKRTIAGMVHDFTRTRIKEQFAGELEIEARDFKKIFGLKICDKLFIRFKKINNDFTTSNIQTLQTKQYSNQHDIEGFPLAPTLLFAGYMPDATWSSIKNIYLMCKQGKNLIWQIDLTGSIEQTNLIFETPTAEFEETVISRVKVKTKEIKIAKTAS